MSGCNAKIQVGGTKLACEKTNHPDREGHTNAASQPGHWSEHAVWREDIHLIWNDAVPGATPHKDPTPTYETDHLSLESTDELRAERLRYRKALERIEFLGNNPTMRDTLPASYEIARRVLDGGQP